MASVRTVWQNSIQTISLKRSESQKAKLGKYFVRDRVYAQM
jgi:hypothetical protein